MTETKARVKRNHPLSTPDLNYDTASEEGRTSPALHRRTPATGRVIEVWVGRDLRGHLVVLPPAMGSDTSHRPGSSKHGHTLISFPLILSLISWKT